MASSSRTALPSAVLALRLLTLALLAASLGVIAADKLTLDFGDGLPPLKITFKDVYAYRYVLAIAVIGCAYTLLQIPFVAISIAKRKRMIGSSEDLALFLIFADVSAFGGSKLHGEVARFFNMAYAAAGLMLLAAAAMALIIMLSVYSLVR
uniref:CASP-like protein n=1 Tax=Oryza punctata TaxID=4537 RepID=A0A0E0MG87_ORYPU